MLLFINKIDILVEKVSRGHYINKLCEKYPDTFPDYNEFVPTSKNYFMHFTDLIHSTGFTLKVS